MDITIYAKEDKMLNEAKLLSERMKFDFGGIREFGTIDKLSLWLGEDGLWLAKGKQAIRGDFSKHGRRIKQGIIHSEMLVRAAKIKASKKKENDKDNDKVNDKKNDKLNDKKSDEENHKGNGEDYDKARPVAIDATAGMGDDAILLAAAGFEVKMFEKNPVIALLLEDALKRARQDEDLSEIANRMELYFEDSIEAMKSGKISADVVLLDPMFPERQKSALIKKKFQLLQKLESPCSDEKELLEAAIMLNPKKIVIKRPLKGAFLADRKPDYSLKGKAIRYDCILTP